MVVPCYNEEEVLETTWKALTAELERYEEYEILFVDDGSADRTVEIAQRLADDDPHVKLLSFSRNFGHHKAITAGMDHAEGDVVILADADLQDPPELIHTFVEKWREGFDVLYGVRADRSSDSPLKRLTSSAFYRLMDLISDVPIPREAGNYGLIDRQVVDALRQTREEHRLYRGLVSWAGFRQMGVPFVRQERAAGTTKYDLRRMVKLALDSIFSLSSLPLRFVAGLGAVASFVGLLAFVPCLVWWLSAADAGRSGVALILATVVFGGGVQLLCVGLVGEYVGRVYDQVKGRPLYVTQELRRAQKGEATTATEG